MIYNGVSKILAAEEQLKSAVRLFFKNSDPVSIHTLASASQEILEALAKRKGIKSMRLKTLDITRSDKRKILLDSMKESKNFFKHADKDHDKINALDSGYTELVLWDAVNLYYLITEQKIPCFIIYDLWAYSKYPEIYKLTRDEENDYKKTLGNYNHENKEYFLKMINDLESKIMENIKPNEEMIYFGDKNFGNKNIVFDQYTKVWQVFFTLNGENIENPSEQLIFNFYLKNVWESGSINLETIAKNIVIENDRKIIGEPFIAPDDITKKSGYFIILYNTENTHGYIHIIKIIDINDSAVSIIYSKKIIGTKKELKNNINLWLIDNLKSNEIANIGVDESWIDYLLQKQKNIS